MTQEEFEIQRYEISYALTGDYSRNRRRAKEVFRSRKARVLNIKEWEIRGSFNDETELSVYRRHKGLFDFVSDEEKRIEVKSKRTGDIVACLVPVEALFHKYKTRSAGE